jgi:hypothetical protein
MMSTLHSRTSETTDAVRHPPSSVTEDYEGLAWYLARAIARGDANFDSASAELHASASSTEQASLKRAAVAARGREGAGSLVARLLGRDGAGL